MLALAILTVPVPQFTLCILLSTVSPKYCVNLKTMFSTIPVYERILLFNERILTFNERILAFNERISISITHLPLLSEKFRFLSANP